MRDRWKRSITGEEEEEEGGGLCCRASIRKEISRYHRPMFPPPWRLLLLHVLKLCFVFLGPSSLPRIASSSHLSLLHFSIINFGDDEQVELVKEGEWYTGKQNPTIDASGSVWLTPDPRLANSTQASIVGRAVYKGNFLLPPDVSFSTYFQFTIITNGSTGTNSSVGTCGSGMAFFISTSKQAPNNSVAGALGLVYYQNDTSQSLMKSPAPFFAVEFDTRISPAYRDVSGSHIGIDINSLVSANISDTNDTSSPLFLYANYRFSTWVDYNATSQMIEVRVTNASARPSSACVTYRTRLSDVFPPGVPLYLGFSSTNRPSVVGSEGAAVHSWTFSSSSGSSNSSPSNSPTRLALLVSLPIVAAAAIAAAALLCSLSRKHRRRRLQHNASSWPSPPQQALADMAPLRHYSYKTLKKATEGFHERNKIGEGANGVVYKGVLPDCKTVVAIKRMKCGGVTAKAVAEMLSEVRIISAIRHRNLVRLYGWCYEEKAARDPMLVYQYMSNGSLEGYIYGSRKGFLSGEARLKILKGVAAGIEYLHSGLGKCILHRDVKAANVLLTEEYEAVVGDFGLARMIGEGSISTLSIAGTIGYMAPDVVTLGKATRKGDVYSFGVLAMEVACGRRCLDPYLPAEQVYVVDWCWLLHAEGKLETAIDPNIRRTRRRTTRKYWPESEHAAAAADIDNNNNGKGDDVLDMEDDDRWLSVLRLALLCCHPLADHRPDMHQVARALSGDPAPLQTLPSFKPPSNHVSSYLYMYTTPPAAAAASGG